MLGARGGVLTSAALIPGHWAKIQVTADQGEVSEALAEQRKLNLPMDALFAEEFPSAVRAAFEMIGIPIGHVLPPVGELSGETRAKLSAAISALKNRNIL